MFFLQEPHPSNNHVHHLLIRRIGDMFDKPSCVLRYGYRRVFLWIARHTRNSGNSICITHMGLKFYSFKAIWKLDGVFMRSSQWPIRSGWDGQTQPHPGRPYSAQDGHLWVRRMDGCPARKRPLCSRVGTAIWGRTICGCHTIREPSEMPEVVPTVSDHSLREARYAMTSAGPKARSLVVYIRDAKDCRVDRNLLDRRRMQLSEAVDFALARHRPGESPVIIGTGLQLIGIDAIRAARDSDLKSI
jgi:hypothetical protein